MKKTKTVKVSAWLIINRRADNPYVAFIDKIQARLEMKQHEGFHKNDVLIPATITYTLPITHKKKTI